MKIGIVIGRIGGVDGVALETEKWMDVLERMGHECHILTGELEAEFENTTIVPELAFNHVDCEKDQDYAFYKQDVSEEFLDERLEKDSEALAAKIEDWIQSEKIDVLLTENATTLPCHLTMGIALTKVMERTGIKSVSHNHDFYWERGGRYKTGFKCVTKWLEKCFPPKLPNVRHAVINTYCFNSLKKQMDIDAVNVPNVMDFMEPYAQIDEYNKDLPEAIGLKEDEIAMFQITRIVRRKGIETAIDLVHRLSDKKVKLFITGKANDDHLQIYYNELVEQIKKLGLEDQVFFISDIVDNFRGTTEDGKKIYSLGDAYAHANSMTYFSTYEGFGNAYVEALLAKVPIFVNNYKPVYWPDIGSKGFKTVQLEDNVLTDEAVAEVKKVIYDEKLREEIAEYNFELGKKHFSYEVLQGLLEQLFKFE
jgi:glycosyltransferase involved in cell wall biosynthesis